MALTYDNLVKTSRMAATRDEFVNGSLEIQDADGVALAIFTLSGTAGTVSTDIWTLEFVDTTVSAAASGTATQSVLKDAGGVVRLSGLVAGLEAPADVILDNTSINAGQDVNLSVAQIQHAA